MTMDTLPYKTLKQAATYSNIRLGHRDTVTRKESGGVGEVGRKENQPFTSSLRTCSSTAKSFTVEDMLSAPRPQIPIINPDKTKALILVDHWDSKKDIFQRNLHLLNLNTSSSPSTPLLLSSSQEELTNPLWLTNHTIGYLNGSIFFTLNISLDTVSTTKESLSDTASTTQASISELQIIKDEYEYSKILIDSSYEQVKSGIIKDGPNELFRFPKGISPSDLKYDRSREIILFSGQVWDNGGFEDVEKKDKEFEERGNSGMVFDDLFIRHWDRWRIPGKTWTIGLVKLSSTDPSPKFVNILRDTKAISPMDPIEYTISPTHLAINIKPWHLPPAQHTRTDIHLLPFTTIPTTPIHLTPYTHGAISSLSFSPDGKVLAWLEMMKDGYESDRNIVKTYNLSDETITIWTVNWDRSPSSISWSLDSTSLFLLAGNEGRVLPFHLVKPGSTPIPLWDEHSANSIVQVSKNKLMVSISSFYHPAQVYLLNLDPQEETRHQSNDFLIPNPIGESSDKLVNNNTLHSLTNFSSHIADSLRGVEVEELWTKGTDHYSIMSWILKPPGWQDQKQQTYRWPMVFWVHGGPESAWEDEWSTRWNAALFAKKGYWVVAVNPTGSTGYGQEFTERIKGEWGGKPYKDLLAVYQNVLETYPEIDPQRTAMLGASYGGYMANWINGHNVFGFKAIVCHDGIFDTLSTYYTTEELWFPTEDFMGTPLSSRSNYEKWNPMNHVSEWNTPELVIHSGRDYRLVDGQGFATFTALQTQGVPSRLLYFPDENHWVLKPHNSVKWHHEVFRWLEEWIGVGPTS
ncbi:hypothetical protein TREMEDRAFT_70362 [Tremella mesenterica DSM 1558]|uniref:uncharacterized protein n=1 Tax=Tremella mesenterica (strain ATCC 24925 / CBS 8224 / DSM 1558 / NBRC 9311 / NRRL Y-6157 / RJB 2259-6 / UBC 559-6) TaxID=578456 RepID=UPI00032BF9A2|nr:uncharacterized protein TREMEDRAFT_70362 [Tremella mesenterica DSM 1558]EIW65930.1 hypothetical protein TREMEDRAFT_70362 [Tremella mesenterica DSM 1558]